MSIPLHGPCKLLGYHTNTCRVFGGSASCIFTPVGERPSGLHLGCDCPTATIKLGTHELWCPKFKRYEDM